MVNFFYLENRDINDTSAWAATCAEYHGDKHLHKMIVEYAQIMSTVWHFSVHPCQLKTTRCTCTIEEGSLPAGLYKKSHIHHPVVLWCQKTSNTTMPCSTWPLLYPTNGDDAMNFCPTTKNTPPGIALKMFWRCCNNSNQISPTSNGWIRPNVCRRVISTMTVKCCQQWKVIDYSTPGTRYVLPNSNGIPSRNQNG